MIKNTKLFFNTQYQTHSFFVSKDISFILYDARIWDLAKKISQTCQTIVELGVGGGTLLYNFSKVTTAHLIGVDFSDIAIGRLTKFLPQATFLKEDVTKTSLGNECCDFVASTMTMEHVDDRDFLKEVRRILKINAHIQFFSATPFL